MAKAADCQIWNVIDLHIQPSHIIEPCRRYTLVYALFFPTHGRRCEGWQKTSSMSSYILCPEAAGDTDRPNDLHQEAIVSLATDWFTWRKFCSSCLLCSQIKMMSIIHNLWAKYFDDIKTSNMSQGTFDLHLCSDTVIPSYFFRSLTILVKPRSSKRRDDGRDNP